ncbi:MAG: hypothetical protein IH858_10810 [Chloroflexi bacterium]|nr:hypothetical protein [Chloroflexota bacterium]
MSVNPISSLLWLERNARGEYRLAALGDFRLVVVPRDAGLAARWVPRVLRLVDAVLRFVDGLVRFVERLKGVRLRLRFATVGLRLILISSKAGPVYLPGLVPESPQGGSEPGV